MLLEISLIFRKITQRLSRCPLNITFTSSEQFTCQWNWLSLFRSQRCLHHFSVQVFMIAWQTPAPLTWTMWGSHQVATVFSSMLLWRQTRSTCKYNWQLINFFQSIQRWFPYTFLTCCCYVPGILFGLIKSWLVVDRRGAEERTRKL